MLHVNPVLKVFSLLLPTFMTFWFNPQVGKQSKCERSETSKRTLLGLQLVGRGSVSARGQRGGEEDVGGCGLVLRVGEAGVPPPAAQRLVGERALQGPSGGLEKGTGVRGHSLQSHTGGGLLQVRGLSLTGSLCGDSPGLSMMISFFRSSSIVLL